MTVLLDRTLIANAYKVATGADIHRIKTMAYEYEMAVFLHNSGDGAHRTYDRQYEVQLRSCVTDALLNREQIRNRAMDQTHGDRQTRSSNILRRYRMAIMRRLICESQAQCGKRNKAGLRRNG
jgi:hypothetical protein